jgi:ABC-2 type transport system ATP-binding protein
MNHNRKPVVQSVGLTKVFKDFWHRKRVVAVDHLDFDIYPREVFGLLGPNGSGKTTTIKMMLGLLYPTRGRISVLGRPPTDVAVKARIGYLPEESYLYNFLDARETLDYYGRLFRIPRQDRRRRVEQLLEMVGLVREARRRVGQYSKGMARRIGLAQALINDPDLLILDEPTTGLDPIGTREIKDLITFLNREKHKTIILCSHLLADVEDVCQRVAVLYGGRCQTMGGMHELLSRDDRTQIITDRLDEPTVEQIRAVLSENHKQVISVGSPTAKLEAFFLRTVSEARKVRRDTSGATSGGQIAGFLADSHVEAAGVVDSLVAAGHRAEPVEPTSSVLKQETAVPVVEKPDRGVIAHLMSGPSQDGSRTGPTSTEGTDGFASEREDGKQAEQADRAVIDKLVHRSDRTESESRE